MVLRSSTSPQGGPTAPSSRLTGLVVITGPEGTLIPRLSQGFMVSFPTGCWQQVFSRQAWELHVPHPGPSEQPQRLLGAHIKEPPPQRLKVSQCPPSGDKRSEEVQPELPASKWV